MNAAIEHVQAVAFDLDGTLCDSVPDLAAAAGSRRELVSPYDLHDLAAPWPVGSNRRYAFDHEF